MKISITDEIGDSKASLSLLYGSIMRSPECQIVGRALDRSMSNQSSVPPSPGFRSITVSEASYGSHLDDRTSTGISSSRPTITTINTAHQASLAGFSSAQTHRISGHKNTTGKTRQNVESVFEARSCHSLAHQAPLW